MKEGMSREGSIVKEEVVSGCNKDQHLKITEKIILTLPGIFGYISYTYLIIDRVVTNVSQRLLQYVCDDKITFILEARTTL